MVWALGMLTSLGGQCEAGQAFPPGSAHWTREDVPPCAPVPWQWNESNGTSTLPMSTLFITLFRLSTTQFCSSVRTWGFLRSQGSLSLGEYQAETRDLALSDRESNTMVSFILSTLIKAEIPNQHCHCENYFPNTIIYPAQPGARGRSIDFPLCPHHIPLGLAGWTAPVFNADVRKLRGLRDLAHKWWS